MGDHGPALMEYSQDLRGGGVECGNAELQCGLGDSEQGWSAINENRGTDELALAEGIGGGDAEQEAAVGECFGIDGVRRLGEVGLEQFPFGLCSPRKWSE